MSQNVDQRTSDLHSLLLTLGFLFLTTAITIGYLNPATSYELSIYTQTPAIFWIGIVVGIILSVSLAFVSKYQYVRISALSLGVLCILSIILLPIIRNYYYWGEADSLSHLGRTLDINSGLVSLSESLYPSSYALTIVIYQVTGIEVRRGLVLLLPIFAAIFVLFILLAARLFVDSRRMQNISIFSGLLLLPVNHFTGHMHPHPTSYAMLFIPVILYVFIKLIKDYNTNHVILSFVGVSGIILLHPQQAANIIILFGTIAIVQLIVEPLLRSQQPYKKIYQHVALMSVVFWLWTEGLNKVSGNIRTPIIRFLARSEREAGGNVRSAVPSLEAAGGSPEEIFIKLFLLGFIYCIFSSILMTASLTEVIKNLPNRLYKYGRRIAFSSPLSNLIVVYLSIGFISITSLFIIYILADQSRQYFRHHSFMMVIITFIGSLSIAQLLELIDGEISEITFTTGISILFIIFLLLSVPIIHVSPYLYEESQQVPESQVKGYETAFDHQDESIPFTRIRSNYGRYYDAIIGERGETPLNPADLRTPPYHFSEQGNLRQHYNEQTYLAVTGRDRTRDWDLHRGIRYTREDYEHFDEGRGIERIQDNGGFTLYKINPSQ